MLRRILCTFLALILTLTSLAFCADADAKALPKIKIVLIGDSTVNDEGGWGPGFKKLLTADATCANWAQNGRSSKSFIDEGWWEKALAEKPNYVLIQFGHNDQPGKGPARETDPKTTYPEYLARYIDESRAIGAEPIIVTSLSRRTFSGGKIKDSLAAYADAAKKLAETKKAPLLDLHALSIELLNKIGPEQAAAFNPPIKPDAKSQRPDTTHLGPKGQEVFGKMAAEELKRIVPTMDGYIKSPASGQ